MNLTHRIFMKYGVYGMNRIWSMMKRSLLIGLLAAILPFFMMPGFEVSAKGYKVPKPPETINMFGDILHPVYIGETSDHMHVYTTQESIDNLLAIDDLYMPEGYISYWDLYIILVPGTEEKHEEAVSNIIKDAKYCVTWLPAKSKTLWGIGLRMMAGDNLSASNDMEYYNQDGEMIGFRWEDEESFSTIKKSESGKLVTDFITEKYKEHQKDTYSSYIQ